MQRDTCTAYAEKQRCRETHAQYMQRNRDGERHMHNICREIEIQRDTCTIYAEKQRCRETHAQYMQRERERQMQGDTHAQYMQRERYAERHTYALHAERKTHAQYAEKQRYREKCICTVKKVTICREREIHALHAKNIHTERETHAHCMQRNRDAERNAYAEKETCTTCREGDIYICTTCRERKTCTVYAEREIHHTLSEPL